MDVEVRIQTSERRVLDLEAEIRQTRPKLDHVLTAIVDMHDDVRKLDKKVDRLEQKLPEIIARAVAPLLQELKDE